MMIRSSNESLKKQESSKSKWGFFKPSLSLHKLTALIALFAVLFSLLYTIFVSKGYGSELSIPGFSHSTNVGFQRRNDEYLAELSRYLVDQFQREMAEINKKVDRDLDQNRQLYSEDNIRKLAKEELLSQQEVKHQGIDYASVYSGCKIYDHTPSHSFGSETYSIMKVSLFKFEREPDLILQRLSDQIMPGYCWPFRGDSGFATLELSEPVKISEIVYAHVSKDVEPESLAKSAPRTIEVWGGIEPDMLKFLGETKFNREASSVTIVVEQPRIAKYIKFMVTENYGNDYTCLYRLHVYAYANATALEST